MKQQTKDEICKGIEAHKTKHGGEYEEYYIGITNDLTRRLDEGIINEHIKAGILDKDTEVYEANAGVNDIAVNIEREFQELKGMQKLNKSSFGIEESIYVYCFKIKEGGLELLLEGESEDLIEIEGVEKKSDLKQIIKEKLHDLAAKNPDSTTRIKRFGEM